MLRGLWTAADRQAVAQFGLVTFGLPYSSPSTVQSWINEVRKLNPSIVMGGYTNTVEADASPEGGRSTYTIDTTVVTNDWWLHTSGGQKIQWTTAFDTYVVNLTRWSAKDASGRRFTEWLGDYVAGQIGGVKGLDYVFQDNVWYTPRPYTQYADFMRNGTNQYAMSADIQAAWRLGTTDYMTRLRSKLPDIKVFANADNDLNYAEYKGKYDGALMECAFGKSWSFYERLGWARMMAEYRAQLANTISKTDAILQGCAAVLDLAKLRFGLASAMLDNGWFSYKVTDEALPTWADEYSTNIGTPSEAPPTAPTASGIWMRKYSNGIVLVNPGATTASVNIGAGYRRLQGTQDPVTNNGQPTSIVTLEPNRGLLLVKQ